LKASADGYHEHGTRAEIIASARLFRNESGLPAWAFRDVDLLAVNLQQREFQGQLVQKRGKR
jgi:hypothetical protein